MSANEMTSQSRVLTLFRWLRLGRVDTCQIPQHVGQPLPADHRHANVVGSDGVTGRHRQAAALVRKAHRTGPFWAEEIGGTSAA